MPGHSPYMSPHGGNPQAGNPPFTPTPRTSKHPPPPSLTPTTCTETAETIPLQQHLRSLIFENALIMWPHLSGLKLAISARKTPDGVYGPATIKLSAALIELGPATPDILCEGEFAADLAGAMEALLKALGLRMGVLLHE